MNGIWIYVASVVLLVALGVGIGFYVWRPRGPRRRRTRDPFEASLGFNYLVSNEPDRALHAVRQHMHLTHRGDLVTGSAEAYAKLLLALLDGTFDVRTALAGAMSQSWLRRHLPPSRPRHG